MKKIILSVAMIAAVAAVAIGATTAYFSDVETSTGNTFTAGAIDLTVDSTQHYNGNVCQLVQHETGAPAVYEWVGTDLYPVPGTTCDGTWTATNLGASHKFFNFADVKPGDSGEDTISLHIDNNDAWMRLVIKDVANLDNSCNEPEQGAEPACLSNNVGELGQNLLFSVFTDANCDNILNDTDQTLISEGTIDLQGETWALPTPLKANTTTCYGVTWKLPSTVGNEVQTDSMTATMEFQVEQYRNNAIGFDGV